jgi:hypothetical protein
MNNTFTLLKVDVTLVSPLIMVVLIQNYLLYRLLCQREALKVYPEIYK